MARLFILLQYLTPQHSLSRLVAILANSEWSVIKGPFIRFFVRRYQVNLEEAKVTEIEQFKNFNDFFTRELRENARSIDQDPSVIVSPADGAVSELGPIENGKLLQAKGRTFSAVDLLGGNQSDAEPFEEGDFITVYLSPRDYHRVHMPAAGRLLKTLYVPGKLFSVNQTTADSVPNLFARNERLVCFFDTALGPMAIVLVGAMIVAGIDTVWAGQACPNKHGLLETSYIDHSPPIQLGKGSEMGRFKLGSTVIFMFGPGAVRLNDTLGNGSVVRMGEAVGIIN